MEDLDRLVSPGAEGTGASLAEVLTGLQRTLDRIESHLKNEKTMTFLFDEAEKVDPPEEPEEEAPAEQVSEEAPAAEAPKPADGE